MSQYDQIIQAVHDRAVGAFERWGEFKTINSGWAKLREEFEETKAEVFAFYPEPYRALSDMEKYELHERIMQESLDTAVVAVRLAYKAKQMMDVKP